MKGKITHYGVDPRDHLVYFLRKHYFRWASGAVEDVRMAPETLGKNWSCCVYERDGKRWLICFDGDDGSGGTTSDCKLNWWRFDEVLMRHKIDDYIIFKIQHASISDQRQFYPFKLDVYPLGLMTNQPEKIIQIADSLPKHPNRDIDVIFVGGRVHDHNRPFVWAKNRNINQWWPGNRKVGYDKLLEIKARRSDLRIETFDGLCPPDKYYDLINRSKICIDYPGIGLSSRKFYEFLIMGKCILALKQNNAPWPLQENVHYASLGLDFDYVNLESTIDKLLQDSEMRSQIRANAKSLRPLMTHEAVSEYVIRTVDDHIDNSNEGWTKTSRPTYT